MDGGTSSLKGESGRMEGLGEEGRVSTLKTYIEASMAVFFRTNV